MTETGPLTLVQGMVFFGGLVWTVCVFDGDRFVHRVRSTCCNECAWEAAEEWLVAWEAAREWLKEADATECQVCDGYGAVLSFIPGSPPEQVEERCLVCNDEDGRRAR